MTRSSGTGVAATRRSPQAEQYTADGFWTGQLVDRGLTEGAGAHPERTAIVAGDRRASYGELEAMVARAAGALRALGVGAGDIVSFQLPNWLEAAVVHYASIRLGAASNPISPIYRAREVGFILRQTRSRILVIPATFRRFDYRTMLAEIRGQLPDLEHVLVVGEPAADMLSFAGALEAAAPAGPAPRRATDIALVLYTSGTEAQAKGVLHSHDTLGFECASMIELYEMTDADRIFMPSPVTHITGLLYGLQLPLMLGTLVVLQDIWDADTAFALIERERCTLTIGATPFLHALVRSPQRERHDLGSLRVFGCGGADVPPALIREAHERLGIIASRLYGSTECPTATGTPLRSSIERHARTDGRAIGPGELRIVDEDGGETPTGVRGHLEVRGPELCLGYMDASLNERAFTEDGWFVTGDLAVLNARGDLTIAGRAKDIIVRGGENLSAKEIEDLLFEHPAVSDVAVVGYPDEVLGERACAFVVAAAPVTLDDLIAFLRARRIANQKLPEHLRIVAELPKTASGKVQKYRLRDQLRAEASQAVGP